MRTISTAANAILTGGARRNSVRLSVKDNGGTFRDLTTYPGENFLLSIHWSEDIDEPGIKWEASVLREMESISLSPLMQASPLNKGFNIANSFAPLLAIGRAVKVEYCIQAEDDPSAPTWVLAFTGWLDTVAWGDSAVSLTGRGEEAKLIDRYIERERIYAFAQGANATKGCNVWPDASKGVTYTTFAVGDRMLPTDSKRNGHFYRATAITTGIVAATEPVWPTGGGATVVDGGVTWTESGSTSTSTGTAVETVMQQILDDNGMSAVVLSTPVSPSWAVRWFMVGRQPLFDELRMLADQIGWCIRFKYDSGSGTMKLTFYDPVRSNTTSMRTFAKDLVTDVRRAQVEIFDIRNVVRVVYSDSQDLDAASNPKRKAIEVSDAASIAKFDRRFCEVAESSNSNIDSSSGDR